jgi:hypothetical protein
VISRKKVLLDLQGTDLRSGFKVFACYTEEIELPGMFLPIPDWAELGEPQQITVTIEPGDRLNDTKEK